MREGMLVRSAHAGLVEFRRLRAVHHHPDGGAFAVLRDDRPMGDAADGMPPHMAFRPASVFRHTPPYFATYTIAMWKDPLFSAAVLMLTLLIFDLAASKGHVLQTEKAWLPAFALSCLVACLFRSNGILVAILLAVVLAAMALRSRSAYKKPAAIGAATAIAALLFTGPVFTALGVTPAAKAEGVGIPLNQMARVAATGGIMSDEDKRYLNELLPLELYETVYTPTCVDSVKWKNPEFNEEALSDDFWRHWLSMGIENPVTYLESWELQTVGYWSINQPQVLSHNRNIAAGVPRNSQDPASLEAWESIHKTSSAMTQCIACCAPTRVSFPSDGSPGSPSSR